MISFRFYCMDTNISSHGKIPPFGGMHSLPTSPLVKAGSSSHMLGFESPLPKERKKTTVWWSFFFGRGIGIRTPTYRVRVCCAAVTQFPCVITDYILAHIIWFVNSFFEICSQNLFIFLLKNRARYVIMVCVIYPGVRVRGVFKRICREMRNRK